MDATTTAPSTLMNEDLPSYERRRYNRRLKGKCIGGAIGATAFAALLLKLGNAPAYFLAMLTAVAALTSYLVARGTYRRLRLRRKPMPEYR